jgi:hypothetical protein
MKRRVTGLVKTRPEAQITVGGAAGSVITPVVGTVVGTVVDGAGGHEEAEAKTSDWIFEGFGAEHIRPSNTGPRLVGNFDWRPIRIE